MEEERLLLTQQDRDRLKVLHEVRKGHITQRQAAGQLKLSDRWIRELVERIGEKGDKAVMHGLRGQASNGRIGENIEKGLSMDSVTWAADHHHHHHRPAIAA